MDIEPVDTHVKRAAEEMEASPPMSSRNSPDMLLLPQDSVEAIIESATTLSSQHKDKVYEQEEDKEGDENDDTDTEEEGVKAEGEGVRSDTIYMPVATDENMIVDRAETSNDYLFSPLRKRNITFFRSTMYTLKAIRCWLKLKTTESVPEGWQEKREKIYNRIEKFDSVEIRNFTQLRQKILR